MKQPKNPLSLSAIVDRPEFESQSKEEEYQLLALAKKGNKKAKDGLFRSVARTLVWECRKSARSWRDACLDMDDLIAESVLYFHSFVEEANPDAVQGSVGGLFRARLHWHLSAHIQQNLSCIALPRRNDTSEKDDASAVAWENARFAKSLDEILENNPHMDPAEKTPCNASEDLIDLVRKEVRRLGARFAKPLELYFGFDGPSMSIPQISKKFKVSIHSMEEVFSKAKRMAQGQLLGKVPLRNPTTINEAAIFSLEKISVYWSDEQKKALVVGEGWTKATRTELWEDPTSKKQNPVRLNLHRAFGVAISRIEERVRKYMRRAGFKFVMNRGWFNGDGFLGENALQALHNLEIDPIPNLRAVSEPALSEIEKDSEMEYQLVGGGCG